MSFHHRDTHCGEKAKAMRLQPITIYTILYLFYVYLKVQGDDGPFSQPRHSSLVTHILVCSGEQSSESSPAPQYTMPNNTLDRAIEAVPKFGDRI